MNEELRAKIQRRIEDRLIHLTTSRDCGKLLPNLETVIAMNKDMAALCRLMKE